MAAVTRSADAVWKGNLLEGSGMFNVLSGAIANLPVTWAARTAASDSKTSPEELLAAAHASCYAMALSGVLARAGHVAEQLAVTAVVTFDPPKVTKSALTVRGKIPGIDQAAFAEFAKQGEQGCPISNALRGNVEIIVEATLER